MQTLSYKLQFASSQSRDVHFMRFREAEHWMAASEQKRWPKSHYMLIGDNVSLVHAENLFSLRL